MAVIKDEAVVSASSFDEVRDRLTPFKVFGFNFLQKVLKNNVLIWRTVYLPLQSHLNKRCLWKKADWILAFQSRLMWRAATTTVWELMPNPSPLWTSHWEPSANVTLWINNEGLDIAGSLGHFLINKHVARYAVTYNWLLWVYLINIIRIS